VRVVAFAFALLLSACSATPPSPLPLRGVDAGQAGFADAVVLYRDGSGEHSCGGALSCGATEPACAPDDLLGANDGKTFGLASGALVLVAFRCAFVVSHGSAPDLQVWATVPSGAQALVEASSDGVSFTALGTLSTSDQKFSLSLAGVSAARFVRLTNVAATAIAVDAVQAL
jgi:hypothetical protein